MESGSLSVSLHESTAFTDATAWDALCPDETRPGAEGDWARTPDPHEGEQAHRGTEPTADSVRRRAHRDFLEAALLLAEPPLPAEETELAAHNSYERREKAIT